ncbi:hypothetical protein SKAU_G00359090 [Synaphobranchus kaupii]|uniref:Tankyrase n=1 Tax=Synaphobranchus kaupii TaxID=118154 RepID=A0A9Q1EHX6_SYNKA|nr:hypothetical protein SKAU_G00359090 [Synaphobranchus kaupii]
MATSRRSSQQQPQSLSSPPRNTSLSLTPPGSPSAPVGAAISVPAGAEQDSSGDPEVNPASPDIPAPGLSASSSTSSASTDGGSSSGTSPDSGAIISPLGGGCGTSGAFRELFEACRNGDVSRVKRLVDSVNVNAKDMAGRKSTPLHFAAGFGRKDVVEHLLQTGANVHARDDGGLIPLHNACSFGHAEVVSLLLCQGADPNARDNWNYTPLHEAAIKGKIDVCIVLLQHGADPTIRNTDGKSALDLADTSAKAVLTGEYKKDELLEAARQTGAVAAPVRGLVQLTGADWRDALCACVRSKDPPPPPLEGKPGWGFPFPGRGGFESALPWWRERRPTESSRHAGPIWAPCRPHVGGTGPAAQSAPVSLSDFSCSVEANKM